MRMTLAMLMADLKKAATDNPKLLDQQVLIVDSRSFTQFESCPGGYYREVHSPSGCVTNSSNNVLMIKFDE